MISKLAIASIAGATFANGHLVKRDDGFFSNTLLKRDGGSHSHSAPSSSYGAPESSYSAPSPISLCLAWFHLFPKVQWLLLQKVWKGDCQELETPGINQVPHHNDTYISTSRYNTVLLIYLTDAHGQVFGSKKVGCRYAKSG